MLLLSLFLVSRAIAAEPVAMDPNEVIALEATGGAIMGGVAALGTGWAVAELKGAEMNLDVHMSDPWNATTLTVVGGWYAGMSVGASLGVWSVKRFYTEDGPEYGRVLGGALVGSAAGAVIAGTSTLAWDRSQELAIAGLVVGGGLAPLAGALIAAEVGVEGSAPEPGRPTVAVWATPGPDGAMLGASGRF